MKIVQKESICNQTSINIRYQKGAVSSSSSLFDFKICLWYGMIESLGEFFILFWCLNFECDA